MSNYSHYAYNTYDFRNEWVKKTDEDTCRLKWLFHKNDGYQAPLTLHPFRDKGTIEIERERELSNQRLLYFFMDYSKTTEQNGVFENIKNKRPQYLNLVEVKKSKLQEHTILRFFQEEKNTYLLKEQIGIAETIGLTKLKDGKLSEKKEKELIKKIIAPLEYLAYRTMGLNKDRQNRHHLLFQTMKIWIEKKDKELKDKGEEGLLPIESDLKKLLEVVDGLHDYLKGETYKRAKKLDLLLDRYSCMNLCQLQRIELIDDVCEFWHGYVVEKDTMEEVGTFDLTSKTIVKLHRKKSAITILYIRPLIFLKHIPDCMMIRRDFFAPYH